MIRDLNYSIVGAGGMGAAMAEYLAGQERTRRIVIFDRDKAAADAVANSVQRVSRDYVEAYGLEFDLNNKPGAGITRLISHSDVMLCATDYRHNVQLTELAIDVKTHMIDLGGNDAVVEEQETYADRAAEADIAIVAASGLAPGLVGIVAATAMKGMDVENVRMWVGGLPQEPRGSLQYMKVFSIEGLINEYSGKAAVIRDGEVAYVDALSELKSVEIGGEQYEGFITMGATGTMVKTFGGKVQNLEYNTSRIPGHRDALISGGYYQDIEVEGNDVVRVWDKKKLEKDISYSGRDKTVMLVEVEGRKCGAGYVTRLEMIDVHDGILSSMQRTTAFPAAITAEMLAEGIIRDRGVLRNEVHVAAHADVFLNRLWDKGIEITLL